MQWTVMILGTLFAFLAAVIVLKLSKRLEKKMSYEELRRDRDVSVFVLAFVVFWMVIVAWRIDLSFLEYWAGVVYAVGFVLVYSAVRFLYRVTYPSIKQEESG